MEIKKKSRQINEINLKKSEIKKTIKEILTKQ